MARFYDALTEPLRSFIARQHIFFTASAASQGRVNCSPKGSDTLRILDNRHVAYLDLTGSGNETAAHLTIDGRLTLMFCAFAGDPLILRLYGRGRAIRPRDGQWTELRPLFPELPGVRQIILLAIESIQTSCGYGVPLMAYERDRDTLIRWTEDKGEEGIRRYWEEKNRTSIDGLPTGLIQSRE